MDEDTQRTDQVRKKGNVPDVDDESQRTQEMSPPPTPVEAAKNGLQTDSNTGLEKNLYNAKDFKTLKLEDLMESQKSQVEVRKRVSVVTGAKTAMEEKQVLDQQQFDNKFGATRVDLTLGNRVLYHFKEMGKWQSPEWLRFMSGRMPICRWLPSYNWREWTQFDLLGGLMVSIMTVPQGLAYGYLVGVPPNYGLITSIFGPFIYALFGSSRHTSPGSFAIVSLMVGSAVAAYSGNFEEPGDGDDSEDCGIDQICCFWEQVEVPAAAAVNTACALTLMVGIFQIIFGLLNAGILAVWLSDHLVMGLTSGAAIHVFTSQLKSATGIHMVPPTSEPFGIVTFYICFFAQIREIQWSSFITFVISVVLLAISSYIIDPIHAKWTEGKFKFPMELFLVAGSTLIVWLGNGTRYHIEIPIVGHVDSGLVAPRIPSMSSVGNLLGPAISIAVVSFVIHIDLAKLISKQLKYEIDANQEWLALGLMHFISSFFGCFAGGSSLGRSMMQKNLQTKSQLSTIVCCIILIAVVFGGSTLVYYLPKAVLAAIVVMAMKDLFFQIGRGFQIFDQSIVDFLIFVVTFTAVVLINVNIGLIVGVAFALLSVVFRSQWADYTLMGRIPETCDYKGIKNYQAAKEEAGMTIFRFDAPVYFANTELFIKSLHMECGVNPLLIGGKLVEKMESERNRQRKKSQEKSNESGEPLLTEAVKPADMQFELCVKKGHVTDMTTKDSTHEEMTENHVTEHLTHIIIDCSTIAYVDLSGMSALAQVFADYAAINIVVLFAHCKVAVRQFFERSYFYGQVPKSRMFVSIQDAVDQARKEQEKPFKHQSTKDLTPVKITPQTRKHEPVAHSPPQKTVPKKDAQATDANPQRTQSGSKMDLEAKTQSNTDVIRRK